MRVSCSFALSTLILGATCRQFEIPEVEHLVQDVMSKFQDLVHYSGNHSQASQISARQASPYWYETISHQGISAFGPSGYQVYRNVKDYGAKGRSRSLVE